VRILLKSWCANFSEVLMCWMTNLATLTIAYLQIVHLLTYNLPIILTYLNKTCFLQDRLPRWNWMSPQLGWWRLNTLISFGKRDKDTWQVR
jgi:hypothetical protein